MQAVLVPKSNYPPYIKILDDNVEPGELEGYLVIWTKQEALKLAHKLMSLAHGLQREIDK